MGPLELVLQAAVSFLVPVLGTTPESSGRSESALNYGAISPAGGIFT